MKTLFVSGGEYIDKGSYNEVKNENAELHERLAEKDAEIELLKMEITNLLGQIDGLEGEVFCLEDKLKEE